MDFLAGYGLGLSLILAIGAQNAFVLRQGLRGEHVLAVVLTCALSDMALIAAGVGGTGAAVAAIPVLGLILRWGGAVFLFAYAALSFRRALRGGEALIPAADTFRSRTSTLAVCLALTWGNPHVYLDTVVLIGSVSAAHGAGAWTFGAGAATASLLFFVALGFGARTLRRLFARPAAWAVLEVLVGITMLAVALGLVLG